MGKRTRTRVAQQQGQTIVATDDRPLLSPPADRVKLIAICAALVLSVLLVYGEVRDHEFINYDDPAYVTENSHVLSGLTVEGIRWAFTTFEAGFWQPLVWISLMIDVELFGAIAGRMALVNVVFHAVNAVLLLLVLHRATRMLWRSSIVAALFALHPLRVESVAWVTERKDVLSGLLFLLSILCWLSFLERRSSIRHVAAVMVFAAALMAKATVITLPFVLVLLDYWPLDRLRPLTAGAVGRSLREKWTFFMAVAGSALMTLNTQQTAMATAEAIPFSVRIANAFLSYAAYVGKTFVPVDLALIYPYEKSVDPAAAIGAAIIISLITAAAFLAGRSKPYLPVGWLWFLGTLVPAIGLVQVGHQARADRFTYIPSIGLLLAVVWLVGEIATRSEPARKLVSAVAAVAIVILAVLAFRQVGHWKNSVTILEHTLAVTRNNGLAHLNLGAALLKRNAPERALSHYDAAVRHLPRNAVAHLGRGVALMTLTRRAEAAGEFRQAISINPNLGDAHRLLGDAELALGNREAARQAFQRAMKLEPNPRTEAQLHLADDNIPAAITAYERALVERPRDAEIQKALGVLLERAGRESEALARYETSIAIDPSNYDARLSYGALLSRQGRDAEAAAQFAAAAELKPAAPESLVYLALIHAKTAQIARAIEQIERAIAIDEKSANQVLTKALRLAPRDSNARDFLAYLRSGGRTGNP